jgi:sugar O-acyltransferase (sialic acid O-acetyltransferase NeuD family)
MSKRTHGQVTDAPLIIIGGGGHTRVLIDVLQTLGAKIEGIVTQDTALIGTTILGVPVLCLEYDLEVDPKKVLLVNGIGNYTQSGDTGLHVRRNAVSNAIAKGYVFTSVISPHAIVSRHATLASGAQILHGAVVQPCAMVGEHTIINSHATIEHDARIGAYAHIAPAAVVCGDANIGELTHIGANATILQGRCIGKKCIVGAGARVVKDIPENTTFI